MRLDAPVTSPDVEWLTTKSQNVADLQSGTMPESSESLVDVTIQRLPRTNSCILADSIQDPDVPEVPMSEGSPLQRQRMRVEEKEILDLSVNSVVRCRGRWEAA